MKHDCPNRSQYLSGQRIVPKPITKDYSVTDLIDKTFNAYNAGRIKDAAELIVKEYSQKNVTVGMSMAGALTPAGMASSIIPLIEHGFVDWIVATGANMYHDMHYPF